MSIKILIETSARHIHVSQRISNPFESDAQSFYIKELVSAWSSIPKQTSWRQRA